MFLCLCSLLVTQQSGYHGQDYVLLVVLETRTVLVVLETRTVLVVMETRTVLVVMETRTVLGQMDRESADVVVPQMYVSIPTF